MYSRTRSDSRSIVSRTRRDQDKEGFEREAVIAAQEGDHFGEHPDDQQVNPARRTVKEWCSKDWEG